jgi:dihydrofolate synthase/folylpolyglutamate synthase
MHRLCSLLGMPQNRFASIHVVGTNGKTSVTRMTAALLEAEGVRTGAYTSPHILDWRERIQIGGEPISAEAFTRALERAEESAQVADRAAGEEGPVTQYELLTAAAFLAFAEARVQIAVIEAGLGGRLDATNVIPSKVTVLTSVGLDHTEWLGDTVEEIAAEKLAVLRDHSTLVTGDLPEKVKAFVDEETDRRPVSVVYSRSESPGFREQNYFVAENAADAFLGGNPHEPVIEPVQQLEESLLASIPGRAEVRDGDPTEVLDVAHNPDGARALVGTMPSLIGEREVICCLAILQGKDAKGIVEALAAACERFVCTQIPEEEMRGTGRPDARAISADELVELCHEAGAEAEAVTNPHQAWARARELAKRAGGVALAAGSHYLLSSIWTERHDPSS